MKTKIRIYWVSEGEEHEGFAVYNESPNGDYITFNAWQNEGKSASIAFDRLDANDLEGGENELRNIWQDLLSDAEASEDFRLDVTYTDLF